MNPYDQADKALVSVERLGKSFVRLRQENKQLRKALQSAVTTLRAIIVEYSVGEDWHHEVLEQAEQALEGEEL